MYADKVAVGTKRSVMDRLGGGGATRARPGEAKRQRQADGTWSLELYKDSRGPQNSQARVTSNDLQAMLSRDPQQSTQVLKKLPAQDLRGKLSGTTHSQKGSIVQHPKPMSGNANRAKTGQTNTRPAAAMIPITKKVAVPTASGKPSREKVELSLDGLLKLLGLEKYSLTFQAEEVDMKALAHMTEEDLKSLGIPMGPRKKILSALASKIRKPTKLVPPS